MKNEKGQALIELIIFLPLMITLYSVIGGYANSINGSINQQKVTRAYFYYRIQNNSTTPGPKHVQAGFPTWKQFGMFYIGWKDHFGAGGEIPVMTCYKVSIPFKNSLQDKCEEKYTQDKTLWVRVGTVYGICGSTFVNEQGRVYYAPDLAGTNFTSVVDRGSCLITR